MTGAVVDMDKNNIKITIGSTNVPEMSNPRIDVSP